MEHSDLFELISCLEYGTKLHISIVFLNNYGNVKTMLPTEHVSHSKPYCDFMKAKHNGLKKCIKCRNLALKKAVSEKVSFAGLCINGIYEYCHPVIDDRDIIAVIFIGNILSKEPETEDIKRFYETFELNFDEEKCRRVCRVLENHIKLLISEYPSGSTGFNPLIENIRNYIEESLYYDISVGNIASVFNYNEKYIGKLFKRQTGKTLKEYVNAERLKRSKELLKNTSLSVTEISAKVGFNSVSYFNRLFKRYFNMSPTIYRSMINR